MRLIILLVILLTEYDLTAQRPNLGIELLSAKNTALCFNSDSSIVWFLRGERLDSIVHLKGTCYLLKDSPKVKAIDPPILLWDTDNWVGRWQKKTDVLYNGAEYLIWLDMRESPPYIIVGGINIPERPRFVLLLK